MRPVPKSPTPPRHSRESGNLLAMHCIHSPEWMLIVDEAHAVEESQFDAARRLNAKKTILAGNAFSTSGELYDSHHSKRGSAWEARR